MLQQLQTTVLGYFALKNLIRSKSRAQPDVAVKIRQMRAKISVGNVNVNVNLLWKSKNELLEKAKVKMKDHAMELQTRC